MYFPLQPGDQLIHIRLFFHNYKCISYQGIFSSRMGDDVMDEATLVLLRFTKTKTIIVFHGLVIHHAGNDIFLPD